MLVERKRRIWKEMVGGQLYQAQAPPFMLILSPGTMAFGTKALLQAKLRWKAVEQEMAWETYHRTLDCEEVNRVFPDESAFEREDMSLDEFASVKAYAIYLAWEEVKQVSPSAFQQQEMFSDGSASYQILRYLAWEDVKQVLS